MLFTYTSLQESEQELEDKAQNVVLGETASTAEVKPEESGPTPVRMKSALLWSHHLLATSKRKDIQHWSTDLKVWAIAKIG